MHPSGADIDELSRLIEAGQLEVVERVLPFSEATILRLPQRAMMLRRQRTR